MNSDKDKKTQSAYKKAMKGLLWGVLLGAALNALLAGFIFVVDPFYHYHKPWLGLPVILDNAIYQTPGVAENLEYRDVLMGTSMTENFSTAWFDEEMGWNTMKLSYSGARTDDLKAIFGKIFANDRQVDHVFIDINGYQYSEIPWTAYVERPEYLYDDNLLNDYKYLFNHDVLGEALKRVTAALNGAESNVDTAYSWGDPELFGWNRMLENGIYRGGWESAEELERVATKEFIESCIETCRQNLDNILPFIEEHPETEFIFFFPPYSMLYWEDILQTGRVEEKLAVGKHIAGTLLSYENVKVYYFQDEKELVSNMEHYRDVSHHIPEYNRYMFECIRDDRNRLTPENYEQRFEHMRQLVYECDYNQLWETGAWDWRSNN